MTRLDAGVLEICRVPLPALDLVDDGLGTLQPSLGAPIEVEIPGDLPEVEVDQLLIGQVLANLLDNANRHAPPETRSPWPVRYEARVALSVTDAGPGVPRENARPCSTDSCASTPVGGRGSGWLSPRRSSRLTARRSGSTRLRVAAPASSLRCPRGRQRCQPVMAVAKVLVIDDDPSLLRALRVGLQAERSRGRHRGERRAGDLPDRPGLAGRGRARPRASRPRRAHRLPADPSMERSTHRRPFSYRRRGPQGLGSGRRCRRLRHQALRHGGARSPNPHGDPSPGRRAGGQVPSEVSVGPLELDVVHREARLEGTNLELTAKEFDVLSYLAQHVG